MSAPSSFWNSTAAVISAIAALITALVGAAFLFITVFGGDRADPAGSGPPAGAAPTAGKGGAEIQWQDELLWQPLVSVDWDTAPPGRNSFGNADTYVWNDSEVSSPNGMVRWSESREPGRADCADLIATHSVSQHLAIEVGDRYCVLTSEGRIAAVTVIRQEGTDFEVAATVWRARNS